MCVLSLDFASIYNKFRTSKNNHCYLDYECCIPTVLQDDLFIFGICVSFDSSCSKCSL